MKSLVESHIESLVPYSPGKPIEEVQRELGLQDVVKLASNENPLGPSPKALVAIEAALQDLSLYPDGGGYYLKGELSRRLGVPPEQLVLGNGSNELIELVIRTFVGVGENVVTSRGTFIVYRLASNACDRELRESPLAEGYAYDLDAMAELVDEKTKLVFIANPNNPTGTVITGAQLSSFVARMDARAGDDKPILILDEAYTEYVDMDDYPDALRLIAQRPRTILLRTFSKAYGLAGFRCGYGVSSAEIVNYMNRVRAPFNVNNLALVGAQAALGDQEFLDRSVALNKREKARLESALVERGFGVTPSQTNFLLVDFGRPAREVFEGLMQLGVIVRPMALYGLTTHQRITIGTEEENGKLLEAVDAYFGRG